MPIKMIKKVVCINKFIIHIPEYLLSKWVEGEGKIIGKIGLTGHFTCFGHLH